MTTYRPLEIKAASVRSTLDRTFWLAASLGTVASLFALGVVAAIVPNPIFGRPIPPDGAAIGVWLASAPLMGALIATYLSDGRPDRGRPGGRDLETGGFP